jgi:hypothetical protein
MKARTLLIIFGTLIIGFFLGILTSAQIRYQKLKPVRTFFSEEMFRKSIYGAIQPEETQRVKIDEIIGKYAGLNMDLQSDFRTKFDNMMKEFWGEIEPNLTKEQIVRLKEMDKRREEMFKRNQENRPPRDSNDFGDNRNNRPGFNDSSRFRMSPREMSPMQKRPDFDDSVNFRNSRDSVAIRFGTPRPASPDGSGNNK